MHKCGENLRTLSLSIGLRDPGGERAQVLLTQSATECPFSIIMNIDFASTLYSVTSVF